MFKRLLLATILTAATAGIASAAPIVGSFSFQGFGGSFIGGTQTAQTATGLDFGAAFDGTGNGYGVNGTAQLGNTTGSFAGLNGQLVSIADISISGAIANTISNAAFITFSTSPNILLSFSNAAVTRSSTGTSITVAGNAIYTDGTASDATSGRFSLSANSQEGLPTALQFTFTGNASAAAATVPEPVSIALLGSGLVGIGLIRNRRRRA